MMQQPRRIFITGASSGIGEAYARLLAKPGVTLGLLARRGDVLARLAGELSRAGATVHVYPADVVDTAVMQGVAQRFLAEAGGADLVLANAGGAIADTVRAGDAASVARVMQLNVVGVTNTVLPFVPALIAQGSGTLAAVSSFAGHQPLRGRAGYSASKAAVTTFMSALRMDLHGTGVHAMALCPGFVRTPLNAHTTGMIFALDVDHAVRLMHAAVLRRAKTPTFPWQMALLRRVLAPLPEAVVRRLAPKPRPASSF